MTKPTNRLLSLDVLRGITIAGMILVNNPGKWSNIYTPLEHAPWNGLTPTDLVFPFFMFIMGISTYFSLRKYNFAFSWESVKKILRRSFVILLIGWAIAWLSLFLRGISDPNVTIIDAVFCFDRIRILGVLPRLAICYCIASLIAVSVNHKHIIQITVWTLIVYAVVLICGNGYIFSDDNIISVVDHAVLGPSHMYTDAVDGVRLVFDPEGLLSTLPSIAHCLIGFMCGAMIVKVKDNTQRSYNLFIVGSILTMAGFLLSYGLPINKKIWSPTFVLTTCGLASMLLALLIWIIDIKGKKNWCTFFEVFGINPLFLYVLSAVLAILLGFIKVTGADGALISLHAWYYQMCLLPISFGDPTFASLLYAISFVLLNWCVGLVLYNKKIYIKI